MTILITGANRPIGQLASKHFEKKHAVRRVNSDVDLCQPDIVDSLVEGVNAILHLNVYDPDWGSLSEQDHLDATAQGTYVLMNEAQDAGVERVILASSLALFDVYPDDYVVDESWQPQPTADARSLAPYLAELACREFARQGGIGAIGLRFGALGQAEGTTEADVLTAFEGALVLPFVPTGYRWQVFHVYSGKRFPMRGAKQALGFVKEGK